jgi:hypothetical protein
MQGDDVPFITHVYKELKVHGPEFVAPDRHLWLLSCSSIIRSGCSSRRRRRRWWRRWKRRRRMG